MAFLLDALVSATCPLADVGAAMPASQIRPGHILSDPMPFAPLDIPLLEMPISKRGEKEDLCVTEWIKQKGGDTNGWTDIQILFLQFGGL